MIIEGDIIVPIDFEQQLATGCWRPLLWPNGVVPYQFHGNVTSLNKTRAIQAMGEWEAVAGVDFVPRDGESGYILIQDSDANSASVGYSGWDQIVNITDWHRRFIIAHELGHILGMWHEQSRVDRDDYVEIIWGNIRSGKESNFYIHPPDDPLFAGYPFGPYDFGSVMHYNKDAWTIVTGWLTIDVLPPFEFWQTRIGQRDRLSFIDKLTMSRMYPDETCFTGDKWDPNDDGSQVSIADFAHMVGTLLCNDPQPIATNTYSWEFDGWENPEYPCQPTYGDLLQFSLYFLTGDTTTLLTAPNPVQPDIESDVSVIMPPLLSLTGSGSQTFSIELKNSGYEDMFVWMVTVPLELPIVPPSQGAITYSFSDELSMAQCNTTITDVTDPSSSLVKQYSILFIHDIPGGSGADPAHFLPGETKELCKVTIDWDLSSGSIPVIFDDFTRSPVFVPVASTSKTQAGVPQDGTIATSLPAIYQSLWELAYASEYDCGDVSADGNVDIDDVVGLLSCIFMSGDNCDLFEEGVGDIDCSNMTDIDDVVYLINYIFSSGHAPCEDCGDSIPSYDKAFMGSAELTVDDNLDEGRTLLISIDTDTEVQALQLEFSVPDETSEIKAESFIPGVDVYYGESRNILRIGMIDLYAENMIRTGKTEILSITWSGSNTPVLENCIVVAKGGGHIETHARLTTSGGVLPERFILDQNRPNPFNPTTNISFSLSQATHVSLRIYNITGQEVSTLVDGFLDAGQHTVTWNGHLFDGRPAASGVYFYRMSAGDYTDSKKMLLLK